MIRGLSIIAVAATGMSASAFAEPAKTVDVDGAKPNNAAVLKEMSGSQEARQHLIRQGYSNVSDLQKDADGRWTGTAVKDGKTLFVAIDLRKPDAAAVTTN